MFLGSSLWVRVQEVKVDHLGSFRVSSLLHGFLLRADCLFHLDHRSFTREIRKAPFPWVLNVFELKVVLVVLLELGVRVLGWVLKLRVKVCDRWRALQFIYAFHAVVGWVYVSGVRFQSFL